MERARLCTSIRYSCRLRWRQCRQRNTGETLVAYQKNKKDEVRQRCRTYIDKNRLRRLLVHEYPFGLRRQQPYARSSSYLHRIGLHTQTGILGRRHERFPQMEKPSIQRFLGRFPDFQRHRRQHDTGTGRKYSLHRLHSFPRLQKFGHSKYRITHCQNNHHRWANSRP